MPDRCVAANCGNMKDKERNISMHRFPFYGDTRPEAQKRRKRWVDWVKLKRAKWEPSEHSHLCSVHFKPEEFMLQFGNEVDLSNKWLQRDELAVGVFPVYTMERKKNLYPWEIKEWWDESIFVVILNLLLICCWRMRRKITFAASSACDISIGSQDYRSCLHIGSLHPRLQFFLLKVRWNAVLFENTAYIYSLNILIDTTLLNR